MQGIVCGDPIGAAPVLGDALSDPTADQLLEPTLALLPRGPAWRTDETADADHSSYLHRFWRAVCEPFADLYRRAWFLTLQSTACTVTEGLEDWEAEFGLPDPCVALYQSVSERTFALRAKVAMQGSQSVPYFVCLAKSIGYDIQVKEYRSFRCGISRTGGDHRVASFNIDNYWQVLTLTTSVTWFRTGGAGPLSPASRTGIDRLGRLGRHPDLECLLNKWKPAHTKIVFKYFATNTGVLDETFILDQTALA